MSSAKPGNAPNWTILIPDDLSMDHALWKHIMAMRKWKHNVANWPLYDPRYKVEEREEKNGGYT